MFNPNSDDLASTIWSASWARVTRRSATMKFLENCMRAEDTYQFLRILDTCPSVKQIDDLVYVYRYNPNGAIHSGIFEQHRPIYIKALSELKHACRNANVIRSIDKRLGLN